MPGIRFGIAVAVCGTVLAGTGRAVEARTWKWVDENGTTHYSQSRPSGGHAERLSLQGHGRAPVEESGECHTLSCRAERLAIDRRAREQAVRDARDEADGTTAAYPVFPTPVKETDDEKIARLLEECESRRGTRCDSDEEMRRMLLQDVELTHAERRALRAFPPSVQRRILLRRIPKRYRTIE